MPIVQVLLALQADNWHNCFAKNTSMADNIRSMMKAAFNVSTADFQSGVISKTKCVIQKLIIGLKAL